MAIQKTNDNFLPQRIYEALRWIIAVILPAISTLISALNSAWNWGLPIDAILSTFSATELFLGTVFGISYIQNKKGE